VLAVANLETKMRIALAMSALVIGFGTLAVDAVGQGAVPGRGTIRPTERFCLQSSDPLNANGLLCRFETRAQCEASKTAQTDFCLPNAALSQQR
jgi:hypothetical protein